MKLIWRLSLTLLPTVLSSCATTEAVPESNIAELRATDQEERYLPREEPTTSPSDLAILSVPAVRAGESNRSGFALPNSLGTREAEGADLHNYSIVTPSRRGDVGDPLKVHILNIGSGSCQIVECPDSDDLLIADCGSMKPSSTDLSREDISTYLSDNNLEGEIILTLSHPHEDHYNRVVALMGERTPRSIWLGGEFNGYGGEGEDRIDRWLDKQRRAGVPLYDGFDPHFANRGMPVKELACGSAETYILTVNVGSNPNENSMLLLVEYGNFRILFSGDAEGTTEDSAMDNFGALLRNTSVLTSSHHGASTEASNDFDWVEGTLPQVVVFSSGLSHEHPKKEVVERYWDEVLQNANEHELWWSPKPSGSTRTFKTSRALYATEVSGTVLVETDGNEFSMECNKDGVVTDCF